MPRLRAVITEGAGPEAPGATRVPVGEPATFAPVPT